jgi:hypothetical protein
LSPSDLVTAIGRTLPGFADYVRSDKNLFDQDSLCGVFGACSHFVKDHPPSTESWRALALLVNSFVRDDGSELDEAACTCFLENLAQPDHPLRSLLEGEALHYWKRWE